MALTPGIDTKTKLKNLHFLQREILNSAINDPRTFRIYGALLLFEPKELDQLRKYIIDDTPERSFVLFCFVWKIAIKN